MITLYHRTTKERAEVIMREKRMVSKENTGEAYFSTHINGQAIGYGEGIVCVCIPESMAEIDDEFPSGEQHFRVHVDLLMSEHFKSWRQDVPGQAKRSESARDA